MSKLERWLTLVANLSVVAGIVFLAAEMRQNTAAIQAQTRDGITAKQMEYLSWRATSPELATVLHKVDSIGWGSLSGPESHQWRGHVAAQFREWENSQYQYEQGLFNEEDYVARRERWRAVLTDRPPSASWREFWEVARSDFAPSFRAEIDRIVAEVEQAQ
jgi:hypothetical protein